MNQGRLRRALNGVFPVLKPHGVTSAQLLNQLKEKLAAEVTGILATHDIKLGHGGTLDSSATGVLTVGVGDGCRQLKCLLHGEKSYLARCQLGVATDTYNKRGKVVLEKQFDHITEDVLQERLHQFEGKIKQVPPLYSALKKNGRRYSDLAQEGVNFSIEPRTVHCYKLKLQDFEPPYFTLSIVSGPGFYVRSLVNDLGLVEEATPGSLLLALANRGFYSWVSCFGHLGELLEAVRMCVSYNELDRVLSVFTSHCMKTSGH
ncbi:tRNA pseudouridine synthase 1-like [Homarus americanus]|uniref:tRNA pseudouridine(55) synthase n=1 Tax=Homarus americanus TaxID=6706 RepID=A0A8J5K4P1_HOMAM|nr:tRNA pseudouridine synthase 1-like [Homarus americanus]